MGGAEVYQLTLPYVSRLHLSIIDYEKHGDCYFPEYLSHKWNTVNRLYFDKKVPETPISWEYQLLEKCPEKLY